MSNEGTPLAQRTDRPWRSFAVGTIGAAMILLLACSVLAPRFAELEALVQAVLDVALAVAAVGVVLWAARATRAVGAGVVAGVGLGLGIAWSALVAYIGLLMR